ncbi:MAG: hypothetical protein J0M12_12270 [Deltaproteobacteria bacterium]|nr:hypothetical protein [Deltaproteobacteria bacterium]
MNKFQTLASATLLALLCTACTTPLKLEPQAANTQLAATSNDELLIKSQQFHTVTISPHSVVAAPGKPWRFYVQIKNGSALDVPFNSKDVSVSLNGQRMALLSTDAVRARIMSAHDTALAQARDMQKRVIYGDIDRLDSPDSLDKVDGEEWNPGSSLFDIHAKQKETDQHIKSIEAKTKAQLADINQHALASQNLQPGQTYETFIEFIPPSTLQSGDILSIKIGVEPDVHTFGFLLSQS